MIYRLATILLSLILRIPFLLGLLCGIIAAAWVLCAAAFLNGFYRVYGEG